MKSGIERSALIAGLLVLIFSLHFGLAIAGAPFALVGALLLGVGITLLWLHFNLPSGRPWLPPLLMGSVVLFSTVVVELGFRPVFAEWFAPLASAFGSAAAMFFTASQRTRCNLCNRRLGTRDLTFRCPRCTQQVCEETCWSFEHRRCELCLEQRVPILPLETSWWSRGTGPRMTQGRCQICLASAEQEDLRACPKCRRPQCRNCWDFSNGECGKCGAALPNLPPALGSVIGSGLDEQTYAR